MSLPAKSQLPIDREALARYLAAGYTLIPLHVYTAKSMRVSRDKKTGERKNVMVKDGKRPRDKSWTKRDYSSKAVLNECVGSNINVGIRLSADQLVIDVDPRN